MLSLPFVLLTAYFLAVGWASGPLDFPYERGKDIPNYLGLPSPATVRTLQLDNGLIVCLISHQSAALPAAVALDVLAGELFEGQQRGLASLVANLLLHSSDNYQTCNALSRHLRLSGHHLQVDVGTTNVQYSFHAPTEDLPVVLGIFKSYFICPLLHSHADHEQSSETDEENRDDELGACVSGVTRHKPGGLRSQSQDLRSHSFHQLPHSNPDAIAGIREYFQLYYVADRMRLVICASLPMEELSAFANNHFRAISSRTPILRGVDPRPHSPPVLCGRRPTMPLFVVPLPAMGAPRLQIRWKVSEMPYTSYILGEQVADRLEALLRERLSLEWVGEVQIHFDISCRADLEGIVLTLELTRHGVQALPSVLEAVFAILARQRLSAALNPGSFHDSLRPARQKLPVNAVRRLARLMHHAPASGLVQASLLPSNRLSNIDFVSELLRALSQHCTVILGGDVAVDETLQSQWQLEIFVGRENRHIGTHHYLISLPTRIYQELERSSKAFHGEVPWCQIS